MSGPITLTAFKREVATGTLLRCVENTRFPRLNDVVRRVTKAQGNGFCWVPDSNPDPRARSSFTSWPKASEVVSVADRRITWRLEGDDGATVTLELEATA